MAHGEPGAGTAGPHDDQAESRVFKNLNQALKFLTGEAGYQVAYNTLKKHLVEEVPPRAPKRRGGGWTAGVLLAYAAAHLPKQVNEEAGADKPVKSRGVQGGEEQPGAAEARTRAHADKLAVQAELERMKLDRERGLLVETATMERELALRCKAFRLGLEKWGIDMAEPLAAIFGGEAEAARELLAVLGLGEDKAPLVVEFAQARAERFRAIWRDALESFLDAFATGHWWDEDMRAAWEKMQAAEAAQDAGEADAS